MMESTMKKCGSNVAGSTKWLVGAALGMVLWALVYSQLQPMVDALVRMLGLDVTSHFGEAMAFFLFEVPKVILLLVLIVFVMGVV
ncbi:MAG TPA: hypothetical protein VIU93_11815, partial [Gallionellaceae bacterium]